MDVATPGERITLILPTDLMVGIEAVSAACDRTKSWIMVRAMRLYLAGEGRDMLDVAEGIRQVERGDVHDLDVVLAELDDIAATSSGVQ